MVYNNEATKDQIRRFIQNAIEKAKNPDPKEKIMQKRQLNAKNVTKKYGL